MSSGEIDGGELPENGGGGGNRWPRQETIALLQIRSEMEASFRDSSLKGPLWEDVSRKMAELGYHRSGKKCKEKFENVYKYHKRTKDGRLGKSEGKTYRFFDQLKVLEEHHSNSLAAFPPPQAAVPVSMVMPALGSTSTVPLSPQQINFAHVAPPQTPLSVNNTTQPQQQYQQLLNQMGQQVVAGHPSAIRLEPSSDTPSSSSSTSSDEDVIGGRRKGKRKWQDFFEKLMKDVVEKQERLQKRFLDAVEKREHERVVREEAWKMQEVSRLNREHEILVRERSMAAAKDAALISFLQKLSEQQQVPLELPLQPQSQLQPKLQLQPPSQLQPVSVPPMAVPTTQPQQVPQPQPQPQPQILRNPLLDAPPPLPQLQPQPLTQLAPQHVVIPPQTIVVAHNADLNKTNNGVNPAPPSSSRWPKAEVEALINLRTNMDQKYQDQNCPKGPLWEEMSSAMKKIGYNRNAKRCKEKWENINKYFKKVKESSRKRPQDSKTCPYFEQLDALYRQKNDKGENTNTNNANVNVNVNSPYVPPTNNLNLDPDHEDTDEDGDGEEDDDLGIGYEIVPNNANANAGSMSTSTIPTTVK